MITLFLICTAVVMLVFAAVWAISVRMRNYGLLDAAWSLSCAALAPVYALAGSAPASRRWLITAAGVVWSLRLGTAILRRVLRHHPVEDRRYLTLRERWPGKGLFFLFFQIQALIAMVFSLPFLLTAFDGEPLLRPLEIAGVILAVIGIAGESLADAQLATFIRDSRGSGQVCQTGLWRYSRHPNYFFESLVWWGFFLAAVSSPWGWITLACPVLMLYFLLCVTGIPLTEKHSLKSKGEAYRAYQRRTSIFIPWFPRNPS